MNHGYTQQSRLLCRRYRLLGACHRWGVLSSFNVTFFSEKGGSPHVRLPQRYASYFVSGSSLSLASPLSPYDVFPRMAFFHGFAPGYDLRDGSME